jgi:hypothetical protein
MPLEPLLVIDGAAAESYVYADPDAAIVMARRFTETLGSLVGFGNVRHPTARRGDC